MTTRFHIARIMANGSLIARLALIIGCLGTTSVHAAAPLTPAQAADINSETADTMQGFGWHNAETGIRKQLLDIQGTIKSLYGTLTTPNAAIGTDAYNDLLRRAQAIEQNAHTLAGQIQSYETVYSAFLNVVGKTAVTGEDASVTQQRIRILAGIQDIQSSLMRAKLAELQAHQLVLGVQAQAEKLHQAQISRRTPSPFSPLFWTTLQHEGPQNWNTLLTFPSPDSTPVTQPYSHYDRWALLIAFTITLAGLLILPRLTIKPIARLMARLSRRLARRGPPQPQDGPDQTSLANAIPIAAVNGGVTLLLVSLLWWLVTTALGLASWTIAGPLTESFSGAWFLCGLLAGVGTVMQPSASPVEETDPVARVWPRGLHWWLSATVLIQCLLQYLRQESGIGLLTLEAMEAVFTLVVAWSARSGAMRLGIPLPTQSAEDAHSFHQAQQPSFLAPLRAILTIVALLCTIAIALGYLSLAYATVNWLLSVGVGLALTLMLAVTLRKALDVALAPTGVIGSHLASLGAQSRYLSQISVLISGAGNLLLLTFLASIAMANGSFDPLAVLDNLQQLFIGKTIGGISISLDTVIGCILTILFGRYAIQIICRWMRERLFPTTQLDIGAQTSILSIFTYVSWILLFLTVLSEAGLTIKNLAWVVSALSVGIGFGLQSIVQNFVSGIILLAERPVRVGDMVEIGGNQGDIRRISVRSTELGMADGSTMIVPNSQFITSSVRNATLGGGAGKISIAFTMPAETDMERARTLLFDVLKQRADVMMNPAPTLNVTALSDTSVTIALSVQIVSSRAATAVRSGIVMDAHDAFTKQNIALATA